MRRISQLAISKEVLMTCAIIHVISNAIEAGHRTPRFRDVPRQSARNIVVGFVLAQDYVCSGKQLDCFFSAPPALLNSTIHQRCTLGFLLNSFPHFVCSTNSYSRSFRSSTASPKSTTRVFDTANSILRPCSSTMLSRRQFVAGHFRRCL
jgi:hypothetical protein